MVESSGLLSRTRELSLAEVQILHPPFFWEKRTDENKFSFFCCKIVMGIG